jgi:hypothetical protein
LSELPDRRFAYAMKRALPGRRSRLVLTGVELLEKLVRLFLPANANATSVQPRQAAQNQRGMGSSRRPAGCGRRWCRRPS